MTQQDKKLMFAKVEESLLFWGFVMVTRSDIDAIVAAAGTAERESCANVAEDLFSNDTPMDCNQGSYRRNAGDMIAEAIRKRG